MLMSASCSFQESSKQLNPEGYLQTAKDSSKIDKLGLCFSKDRNGITPLHYAAINGNLHVVRELIFCCPESAKETTFNGETLLHLVVKNNNQYEVVISLLSLLDEMDLINEIINYVDKDGNMILHLAAARKQQQVIIFRLRIKCFTFWIVFVAVDLIRSRQTFDPIVGFFLFLFFKLDFMIKFKRVLV